MESKMQVKQPRISIVIPAYNVEDYLSECLDSVRNQTYRNLEIIIVDDGSTDHTGTICDEYAQKDDRITVIHTKGCGVSEARNLGLRHVSGEYVQFVDSDDWIDPDTCEKAMSAALEHDVDMVIWCYVSEHGDRSLRRKSISGAGRTFFDEDYQRLRNTAIGLSGDELNHPERLDSLSCIWNKLYRAEIAKSIRFIDKNIFGVEDLLYSVACFLKAKSAVFIEEYLYHYRKTHMSSLTKQYDKDYLPKKLKLFAYLREMIADTGDSRADACLQNRIALDVIGFSQVILRADGGRKTHIRLIGETITEAVYAHALAQLDTSVMPAHWKLFFGFAKKGNAHMVYLMCRSIKFLKRRH